MFRTRWILDTSIVIITLTVIAVLFQSSRSAENSFCGGESESEMMSEFDDEPSSYSLINLDVIKGTPIKYCAIHCTANNLDVHGTYKNLDWWKRARGWSRPGYHAVIYRDGTLEITKDDFKLDGVQEPNEYTYGVKGINRYTINYAYVGGVDANGNPADTMTDAQFYTLNALLKATISAVPEIEIGGHRDFIRMLKQKHKDCPSFDATFEFCDIVGDNKLKNR